jgi:hypothetical protein
MASLAACCAAPEAGDGFVPRPDHTRHTAGCGEWGGWIPPGHGPSYTPDTRKAAHHTMFDSWKMLPSSAVHPDVPLRCEPVLLRLRHCWRDVSAHACLCLEEHGWLGGCLDVWLFGCLAVWLFGCLAVWLFGCLDVLFVCAVVAAEEVRRALVALALALA